MLKAKIPYTSVLAPYHPEWSNTTDQERPFAVIVAANKKMPLPSNVPQLIVYGTFKTQEEAAVQCVVLDEHFQKTLKLRIPLQIISVGWQDPQALCANVEDHKDEKRRRDIISDLCKQFVQMDRQSKNGMRHRREFDDASQTDVSEREHLAQRLAMDMKLAREQPVWHQEFLMQNQGQQIKQKSDEDTNDALEDLRAAALRLLARRRGEGVVKGERRELGPDDLLVPPELLECQDRFMCFSCVANKEGTGDCIFWIHSTHLTEKEAVEFTKTELAPRFHENLQVFILPLNKKINLYEVLHPAVQAKTKREFADPVLNEKLEGYKMKAS